MGPEVVPPHNTIYARYMTARSFRDGVRQSLEELTIAIACAKQVTDIDRPSC